MTKKEFADRLGNEVSMEGNPILTSIFDIRSDQTLPKPWANALKHGEPYKIIQELWKPMAKILPETFKALTSKILSIELLQTEQRSCSLLYYFKRADDVTVYRGFAPVDELPSKSKTFNADLSPLYQIHNGWVHFFTLERGPIPSEKWELLGEEPKNLVVVLTDGGISTGFDLGKSPAEPYEVNADNGEVKKLLDFYTYLDKFISSNLEFLDVIRNVS